MSEVFSCHAGESALLVSIPHDGRLLAPGQAERMTETGLALPDTDWHVRKLYAFAGSLGASVVAANYSRYVVDLNRPADDAELHAGQLSTGVCPSKTFSGVPLYADGGELSQEERMARVVGYWQPYHDRVSALLDSIRNRHGYALLWDAHSIASVVPALFEGELPALNIGTNDGMSCDAAAARAVMSVADASPYSAVRDGRFRGGYITRHYGRPREDIHAIQLELSQRTYMDEESGDYDDDAASRLEGVLQEMLSAFTIAGQQAGRN